MRIVIAAFPAAAAALLLGGCASDVTTNRDATEHRQLSEDCLARGGILAPTGQQTGRPQLDNVCKITGPADRIRPRD